MSRTFSTNIGSVDSLNVSWRCGCKPKARQMRETAVCESPVAPAMVRVLQCVAPRGTLSSVLAITASLVPVFENVWDGLTETANTCGVWIDFSHIG